MVISNKARLLSHAQARRFYDRFGKAQDRQRFYEEKPLRQLIEAADFGQARRVIDFGCGTGRLDEELLSRHMPSDATLLALDISSTMVRLAAERLKRFGKRAEVRQTDGSISTGEPPGSCDRLISAYLLDLLSPEDIADFFSEASRVLSSDGRLALVSLTKGFTPLSRLSMAFWKTLHRINPFWVGGCRPLDLLQCLPADWEVLSHRRISAFTIPSEVLVCLPGEAKP